MKLLTKLFGGDGPSQNTEGREELFVFAHVPKTGGQTLRDCFIRNLDYHREFIHLGPRGIEDAKAKGLLPFEQRPVEERNKARIILGHNVTRSTHLLVPAKFPRHIVFFRDPAELLVSRYNFEMRYYPPSDGVVKPFEQWYKKRRFQNFTIQWLTENFLERKRPRHVNRWTLRRLNSALSQFWFVGITEFMDRDAPLLLKRMGVPADLQRSNVAGVHYPKVFKLDDDLRQKLYRENELDLELYHHWKERLPKSLAKIA